MHTLVPPIKIREQSANNWGLILHLSQLSHVVVPLAGFIAPIVIWQLKKDEIPGIAEHGRNVANWLISLVIYSGICFALSFILIGIFLAVALAIANITFVLIGAVKAHEGVAWQYPLSMKIF